MDESIIKEPHTINVWSGARFYMEMGSPISAGSLTEEGKMGCRSS